MQFIPSTEDPLLPHDIETLRLPREITEKVDLAAWQAHLASAGGSVPDRMEEALEAILRLADENSLRVVYDPVLHAIFTLARRGLDRA